MDQEKEISEVLERKQALFDYKEHRFKKDLKFAFFQRGKSMVWVKKFRFFHLMT